ncbi:MAG: glutaminyl-peptide cyclotransferase [Rikenellaceae bacterium]
MKYLLIILLFVGGCAGRGRQNAVSPQTTKEEVADINVRINTLLKKNYTQGDAVIVGYEASERIDSANVESSDKSLVISPIKGGKGWSIKTSDKSKVGDVPYKFNFYIGGKSYSRSSTYHLLPLSAPKNYNAVIDEVMTIKNYFLQGLEIVGDTLFVSSGSYGKSFVEFMKFPSKKVLKVQDVDKKYFGEGLTVLHNKIYVLTWENRRCIVYDRNTLKQIKEIEYPYAEGWGLTNDGQFLYMSDGTKYIYKLDPETLKEVDRIEVTGKSGTVEYLNELEWIDGEIWANVFTYNYILRIDPTTGAVKGIVRCNDLVDNVTIGSAEDFLNGIALDKRNNKLYLSGKNWKKLFKVSIKEVL